MHKETKYIANNGKEFDNEYDCRIYEYELLKKNSGVIMLDKDLEPIDNLEYCIYCITKTEEDYDILQEISDYEGFSCPEEVGAYYYDTKDDNWYDLRDKVKELEDKLNIYKKVFGVIKEN